MSAGWMDTYVLSHDEVKGFYEIIDYALVTATNEGFYLGDLHLLDDNKEAVVLSFDRFWRPFIGTSYGYNQLDERCRIPTWENLISLARAKLKYEHRAIDGGRIFITRDSVFYKDENLRKHILFYLIWLGRNEQECDPHDFVGDLLERRIVVNNSLWNLIS